MDRERVMAMRAGQRGIGGLLFLVILILIGVVAVMGMRIAPMYVEHFTVRSTLEGLKDDPEVKQMGPAEVRQSIERRFDINNITAVGKKDLKIRREKNTTIIEVAYEVRRPLVGNLDVVGNFSERVELPSQ